MISKVIARYKRLYRTTDLSTSVMVSKISLDMGISESVIEDIIHKQNSYAAVSHDLATRSYCGGRPRRDRQIETEVLVKTVREFLAKGDTITKACQKAAFKFGVHRVTILRRYRNAQ